MSNLSVVPAVELSRSTKAGDTVGAAAATVFNFFEDLTMNSGDMVSDFATGFEQGWDRKRAEHAAKTAAPAVALVPNRA